MRTRTKLVARLLCVGLVLVGSGGSAQSQPAQNQPDLQPIPEIETEGMQPDVRAVVEAARVRIDELAANPDAPPQALAAAYGELGRAGLSYVFVEFPEICFTNAETLDPSQFKWPYYLGVFYQDQRRLDESAAKLERALQIKPGNEPAMLHLAQVELLRGELKTAERLYESLRAKDGESAVALYGLGRVASARKEFKDAARLYEAALAIQPEATEIHQQLGLAYREMGRMDEARDLLSRGSTTRLSYVDPLVSSLETDFSKGSVYLGLVAASRGQHAEAAKYYRQAMESEPDNPVYRQALAQELTKTGEFDEAIRQHREAVRLAPEDAMARVLLGSTLGMRDGNTDEVIRLYQQAVELSPTLIEARVALGSAYYGRESWNRAVEPLTAAVEIDPENRQARQRLAQVLMRLNRSEESVEHLRMLVERDPNSPGAILTLGQALLRTGDTEEALQAFERTLELPATPRERALAHLELGLLRESESRYVDALDHFRASLFAAPDLKDAHYGLGRTYTALEQYEDAARAYASALLIYPDEVDMRQRRVQSLRAAGQADVAITELSEAIETHPGEVDLVLDLAALQAREGNQNGAIETLTRALDRDYDNVSRGLIAFNAATLYQQFGRNDKAIELFRSAIESSPDFKDAYYNLAAAQASTGDIDGAVKNLRRVVEIDPEDAQAHTALATVLVQNERFVDGRAALEAAHSQFPNDIEITKGLVQVLIASPDPAARDPQAAVPLAEQVYSASPEVENAAWVAAALASAGRFNEAVEWQTRVVSEAESSGVPEPELQRFRQELERLRQQQSSSR